MNDTEICTGLHVEKGLVNINSKNCINSNDRHENIIELIVGQIMQFLCETVKR